MTRTFYYRVSDFDINEDPLGAEIRIVSETGEEIFIHLDSETGATDSEKERATLKHQEKRQGYKGPRKFTDTVANAIRHSFSTLEPILGRYVAISRLASKHRVAPATIANLLNGHTYPEAGGPLMKPIANRVLRHIRFPERQQQALQESAFDVTVLDAELVEAAPALPGQSRRRL